MQSGIYSIKNIENEKIYIGKSKDINRRWKQHRADLRHRNHDNKTLQRDWLDYGETNFVFSILEIAPLPVIDVLEKEYIYRYDKELLYNSFVSCGHPWRKMNYFANSENQGKSSAVEYIKDCDGDYLPLRYCPECKLHKLAYTFRSDIYCLECYDLIQEEIDQEILILDSCPMYT